jgi:hypothetical protein
METGESWLYSQQHALCPYSEPDKFSLYPHPTSWRSILILSSHLRRDFPIYLFPSGFHIKTIYVSLLSPVRATCPIHLIHLDFIIRIIFSEDYRSINSSFHIFSTPVLPCPSYAQIPSSASYFRALSAYVPTKMWENKFHTHKIQHKNDTLVYFHLCIFG